MRNPKICPGTWWHHIFADVWLALRLELHFVIIDKCFRIEFGVYFPTRSCEPLYRTINPHYLKFRVSWEKEDLGVKMNTVAQRSKIQ